MEEGRLIVENVPNEPKLATASSIMSYVDTMVNIPLNNLDPQDHS